MDIKFRAIQVNTWNIFWITVSLSWHCFRDDLLSIKFLDEKIDLFTDYNILEIYILPESNLWAE